jgi:hypothetical protein
MFVMCRYNRDQPDVHTTKCCRHGLRISWCFNHEAIGNAPYITAASRSNYTGGSNLEPPPPPPVLGQYKYAHSCKISD